MSTRPTPVSNKAKIAFTSLFANDDAYWVPFKVACNLERGRDEAREQRDRLAEALRKAISWGDSASHYILHRQNINWTYLNEAKEALQSLTPNQP